MPRVYYHCEVMSFCGFCVCSTMEKNIEVVKNNIGNFPDFPKPGILFRDIFSVMRNPEAFKALQELIIDRVEKLSPKPDVVVGLEARGFLLGAVVTSHFLIPFVPIRKKGKLPGKVHQVNFKLEYGTDTFEMQSDSINPGQNVLVIDDLLATGGSLKAACELMQKLQAKIVECLVVMELVDLKGRVQIPVPVHSFIQYEGH